ncbi:hypothetical protein KIH41_13375 [Litoribacter ruber]|uniref:hypothetical protein n=1 Tax=Litoribacter ruber TaxID=702568 RepID=UPI001BDA6777|nr:hypothetical protein [Litoribacter ruber]MBT0812271.1 hypothetical protein [Litoribacter ruber]
MSAVHIMMIWAPLNLIVMIIMFSNWEIKKKTWFRMIYYPMLIISTVVAMYIIYHGIQYYNINIEQA